MSFPRAVDVVADDLGVLTRLGAVHLRVPERHTARHVTETLSARTAEVIGMTA